MGQVSKNQTVLVTGADGYIGSHVCNALEGMGFKVKRLVRKNSLHCKTGVEFNLLSPSENWLEIFCDVDFVIHTASAVHKENNVDYQKKGLYYDINTLGTRLLARYAALAGVQKFIYISSMSVLPLEDFHPPLQLEHLESKKMLSYAESKFAAELSAEAEFESSSTDLIIVRPAMVYGAGSPGNPKKIVSALLQGIPLPFSLVSNTRYFISIDRLKSIIIGCLASCQHTTIRFCAVDSEPLSTPDLVKKLASINGLRARLFGVPSICLRVLFGVAGKSNVAEKLLGDLEASSYDIEKSKLFLNKYKNLRG